MYKQLGSECDWSSQSGFWVGYFDGVSRGCNKRGSILDNYEAQEMVAVALETDVRMSARVCWNPRQRRPRDCRVSSTSKEGP